MKFASSQLAYLVGDRTARSNLRSLLKYLLTLAALVTMYVTSSRSRWRGSSIPGSPASTGRSS